MPAGTYVLYIRYLAERDASGFFAEYYGFFPGPYSLRNGFLLPAVLIRGRDGRVRSLNRACDLFLIHIRGRNGVPEPRFWPLPRPLPLVNPASFHPGTFPVAALGDTVETAKLRKSPPVLSSSV